MTRVHQADVEWVAMRLAIADRLGRARRHPSMPSSTKATRCPCALGDWSKRLEEQVSGSRLEDYQHVGQA